MPEEKKPAEFAYPAATAEDSLSKKRDRQGATDWQDQEPEKPPPGTPQTIPIDATGPPVVMPHAAIYGSRSVIPTAEVVAGQPFPYLSNYLKALPHYIDDLSRDFGSDIYERIALDPIVYSCVALLILAVLAEGLTVRPAIDDKDDPDYEEAEEIAKFVDRNMRNLEFLPIEQVAWDLLWNGLLGGNRLGEKVYKPGEGEDEGMLVLRSIKPKPRAATGFVVDAYMNTVGLLGLIPGQGFPVLVGSIVANPSVLPNLLPREKFVVFSYNPKDGDPRGNSICRQVYTPWWFKQQTWPEYIRFLGLYATPSVLGTTPENAVTAPAVDQLGNPVTQTGPGGQPITPEQNMATQLANLRNASACAFPYGSTFTLLQASGNGEAFKSAIDLFDSQITQGILLQKLATMEGEHQTRAATSEQSDVMDYPIAHIQNQLELTFERDIFYHLTLYNFGEDAARRLTPKCSWGGQDEADWHTDAESIAQLVTSKFLSPSQFPALDEKLGLPMRTDVSLAEKEADQGLQIAGMKASDTGAPASKSQPKDKPDSKNSIASPKDNNQTPKGGKKQPGDSKAANLSEEETLGFNMDEIRGKYKMSDEDVIRTRALVRALEKIKKAIPSRGKKGRVHARA